MSAADTLSLTGVEFRDLDSSNDSYYTTTSDTDNDSTSTTPHNNAAAYRYITELMDSEDESRAHESSSSHPNQLVLILQELDSLAHWNTNTTTTKAATHGTNINREADNQHEVSIPEILFQYSLSAWGISNQTTSMLEYTMFLWSVGQLEENRNVDVNEQSKRGDLICRFKDSLDALLKTLSVLKTNTYKISNSNSKSRDIQSKSALAVDDIDIEWSESPEAIHRVNRRKWYFLDKCRGNNRSQDSNTAPPLLVSKSLSHLNVPRISSPPEVLSTRSTAPTTKGIGTKPHSQKESLRDAIELALRTGDALGHLMTEFIRTSSCHLRRI